MCLAAKFSWYSMGIEHASVQGQCAEEMLISKTHQLALNQTTNLVLKLALIKRWVYSHRLTPRHGYRAFYTPAKHLLHGTSQHRADGLGWASQSALSPSLPRPEWLVLQLLLCAITVPNTRESRWFLKLELLLLLKHTDSIRNGK